MSCLDDGSEQKKVVDAIVDKCAAVINLRESVLHNRVKHASTALLRLGEQSTGRDHRVRALAALDRYFFLIAFASFVVSSDLKSIKFSTWLKVLHHISLYIDSSFADRSPFPT